MRQYIEFDGRGLPHEAMDFGQNEPKVADRLGRMVDQATCRLQGRRNIDIATPWCRRRHVTIAIRQSPSTPEAANDGTRRRLTTQVEDRTNLDRQTIEEMYELYST